MKSLLILIINFLKSLFCKKDADIPVYDEDIFYIDEECYNIETTIESEETNEAITESCECSCANTYNGKVILLDNGHAKSTCGKCSPKICDDRFYEWKFNREIVKLISCELDKLGIKNHILVPEDIEDIGLTKRANRANTYCDLYGTSNCVFISVHANAFGDGETFNDANGWSVYTTKGTTSSDKFATILFEEAEKLLSPYNIKMRKDMCDGDPDYEENFTVIQKTKCTAVLTENLFYTNKKDLDFLMSDEGKQIIADIHVNAIKKICGF